MLLDGLVIKGNLAEQVPIKGASVAAPILKKHSFAIFVSLMVHLVLLLLLLLTIDIQPPKQASITKKAIKSYLYKMPAKVEVIKPIAVQEKQVENKVPEPVQLTEVVKETVIQPSKKKNINPQKSKSIPQKNNVQLNKLSKPKTLLPAVKSPQSKTTKKKPVQATFSSYEKLENLRNSINKKIIEQGIYDSQKLRSPSVMHGAQIPVPHSYNRLTQEEKRKKNTARMSNDISITKNDDGTCIIEREQFLGSPIEASTSVFACGESKFDKSFREHMKKVRDKIVPKR